MPAWQLTQFDPGIAHILGRVADGAYLRDDGALQAMAGALGLTESIFRAERDCIQSLVLSSSEAIVLAFRGTDPGLLHNWITDLDAAQVDGVVGRVHQGFQGGLDQVWNETCGELFRRQGLQGRPLWITGHSLGGALAVLATANLRLGTARRPVNGLYTFGCPRVGDETFRQAFDHDFRGGAFRFVNQNDPVPRLPTREMGFAHGGTFLYFDEHQDLQNDPGYWNSLLETLRVDLHHIDAFLTSGIADHPMTEYLEGLTRFQAACEGAQPEALARLQGIRTNPATMATP
jgi:triacylglycerol lipase